MSFEKVPNFLVNFFDGEMNSNAAASYRFSSFLLDVDERQLFHNGKTVPLTPKAFDVLVYLAVHGGHLVLKEDLMQAVWPDSFVDEVNLPRIIHTLRRALGEDDAGNKFIETVPTKGYRFVARIETVTENVPHMQLGSPQVAEAPSSEIQNSELAASDYHSTRRGPFNDLATLRRWRPRMVLILTTAFILVVAVFGFWFSDRSRPPRSVFGALFPQTNNGEAYRNYQRGRFLIEQGRYVDVQEALASFEKAIELDPNYAEAYAGKADAKIRIFWKSKKDDDISQSRTATRRALELDDTNSYAHTISCRIKATYDWDFAGAEKECRKAIELDSNFHEARREMAFLLAYSSRNEEALREIDFAVALAPTSFNKRTRGVVLYCSRRYGEAIEQLNQVEETDPEEYDTPKWLSSAYEMKKDYANALEARIRFMLHSNADSEEVAAVRVSYIEGGWPAVLRREAGSKLQNMASARAYAQLGETDKTFEVLNKLYERHAVMLVEAAQEPMLDPIRADPRFSDLIKRIGLN